MEHLNTLNQNTFPRRLLSKLFLKRRILILGDGALAQEVGKLLVCDKSHRYDVRGFLSQDQTKVGLSLVNPGVIGTTHQLFECVEKHKIETIVVCVEDRRGTLPLDSLLDAKSMGLEIVDGHRLYERVSGRLSIDELKPSFLIFSSGFRRKPILIFLKRIGDFFGSLLGLFVMAPLFCVIALLIKLDTPGPVFYRQTRMGLHGYPYVLIKFRSMRWDAESDGIKWATVDDSRVTKIGYWLRKLRLDELPQLVNVLKGEMSLVGPRPERPYFVQELRKYIPYYDLRHTIRPGITGWAQICFQYAGSLEDSHIKLQYDLYYVKNLSLVLDLQIIFRTLSVIWRGEGSR